MPRYEFLCCSCGSFEERRPFEEANAPAVCPICGASARRVYSAPGVISTSREQKKARHLNERGAEPELIRRGPPESPKPVRGRGRPWQLGH